MAVSIRAAVMEDAAAIAHVHVESWRTTYAGIVPDAYLASLDTTLRARLWREWLSAEALVLVVEVKGSVVGFAHGGRNREQVADCDAELYSIYLLKDAQKRGIGHRASASHGSSIGGAQFQEHGSLGLGTESFAQVL